MNLTLLILAAGMGSRYGSLKQLDKIGPSGETIMDYSVHDAIKAGFNKVVFVIRKSFKNDFKEKVITKYNNIIKVECVFQELNKIPQGEEFLESRQKPWGTAHAVLMAKEVINEPFVVINADDFYGANSFKIMADFLNENNNHYALLSYQLKNTLSKNGMVSRGICKIDKNGFLKSVTEHTKIQFENNQIFSYQENKPKELLALDLPTSLNFVGFTPSIFEHIEHFFRIFIKKNSKDLKAEFYLPSMLSSIINQSKGSVKVLFGNEKWFGVTYRDDKEWVVNNIREKTLRGEYPKNLFE
jgi:choline kinase